MVDTQEVASSLEIWSSGFGVGDVTRCRLVDCLRNISLIRGVETVSLECTGTLDERTLELFF